MAWVAGIMIYYRARRCRLPDATHWSTRLSLQCANRSGKRVTMTISHRFDTPMTQAGVPRQHQYSRDGLQLLALLSLAGCGHTEPFTAGDFETNVPFNPTPPIQLTLNRGPDRNAAWLPDGSAILYSTQLEGTRDHDVCLASLPATGGRQRSLSCTLSPSADQRTESLESAAAASDGRLAFIAASSAIAALVPSVQELSLATIADPATRTSLLAIPYTISGHPTHGGISQLRWLGLNRLVYLAEAVNVYSPCRGCQEDTLRSGVDAVWLDLAAGATPQAIAGTNNASGVSPGSSEDEVYYTLGGDTRVYRETITGGAATVVFDFGGAGIVRDVQVVGTRMVAVVGGRVHFAIDPSFGPTQWDSGGVVHIVDLSNGSDVALTSPSEHALYRRPQLSPSGTQVVVERYQLSTSDNGVTAETTVARAGDLYLMGQP
jgi:hypothetical protein